MLTVKAHLHETRTELQPESQTALKSRSVDIAISL